MSRKIIVEYDRGWKATYPSGRKRIWHHANGQQGFKDWVMSLLNKDGDVVEVKYPKTIITYEMRTRRRRDA